MYTFLGPICIYLYIYE